MVDGVLVCENCHNRMPQTGWLETTEVNFLPLLEAERPRSGCQQVCFLLRPLFLGCR